LAPGFDVSDGRTQEADLLRKLSLRHADQFAPLSDSVADEAMEFRLVNLHLDLQLI
jgi:hypothetical protein